MMRKGLSIGAQLLIATLAVPAFAASPTSTSANQWELQHDKQAAIDYRQQFDAALKYRANEPKLATAIAEHDKAEQLFIKGDYKDAKKAFAVAVNDLGLTPTASGVDQAN